MPNLIEIEGFPELARALARTGPDVRRKLNDELHALAQPIADSAERHAEADITGLSRKRSSDWGAMRVGIARGFSLVYVAPRERGVKSRGIDGRRRPKFANTLRDRAMDPAVRENEAALILGAERVVDDATNRWWH